jgi:hypothetical protein
MAASGVRSNGAREWRGVAAAKCQLAANQPSAASAALAARINENVAYRKIKWLMSA